MKAQNMKGTVSAGLGKRWLKEDKCGSNIPYHVLLAWLGSRMLSHFEEFPFAQVLLPTAA